jgi:hypothetical protein
LPLHRTNPAPKTNLKEKLGCMVQQKDAAINILALKGYWIQNKRIDGALQLG